MAHQAHQKILRELEDKAHDVESKLLVCAHKLSARAIHALNLHALQLRLAAEVRKGLLASINHNQDLPQALKDLEEALLACIPAQVEVEADQAGPVVNADVIFDREGDPQEVKKEEVHSEVDSSGSAGSVVLAEPAAL